MSWARTYPEDALEYAQEEAIHIDAPALSHASSSSQTANCDGGTQLRDVLSIDESNLLHWHFANLEYGCAGELRHVSNTWWDQDDADGGFHGYVMFPSGYGQLSDALAENLDVRLGQVVTRIEYENCETDSDGSHASPVHTDCVWRMDLWGYVCVVTVPLGVLQNRNKKEALSFLRRSQVTRSHQSREWVLES